MNFPSIKSIKETLSENEQVPVGKRTGGRFAKLPANVLKDTRISATAKLVFAAMSMESYGAETIAISHQGLAGLCGVGRITVMDALKQLEKAGFIEPFGSRVKQIQPYMLLKVKAEKVKTPAAPVKTSVASVRCGKCKKKCKMLLKVGWCRSCNWDLKVRDIARQEMAKVAS